MRTLALLSLLLFAVEAQAYNPPIGIPAPAFGIDEPTYDAEAHCPNWPSAANSIAGGQTYDCYYVDNSSTSPACTDTANTYGYPAAPRCTIPSGGALSAGTFIDVRGGRTTAYTNARFNWSGTGTATDYILITGANAAEKPKLSGLVHLGNLDANVKYFILDGFEVVSAKAEIRPLYDSLQLQYIAFRNLFVNGAGTFKAGDSISADYNAKANVTLDNIVFYNNEITKSGQFDSELEDDSAAYSVQCGVTNIWILDSEGYNTGGDGVILAHGCNFNTHHVYIGRNTFYHNQENGLDLKAAAHVIASENTIYDHRPHATYSAGEGIVVHYETQDAWLIFNKIYNCERGIVITGAVPAYILGNVIWDINHSETWNANSAYSNGIAIQSYNSNSYIVDNTLYDYDHGIGIGTGTTYSHAHGNIMAGRAEATGFDMLYESGTTASIIDYNLFYNSGGERIGWGNATPITNATLVSTYSKNANAPSPADPLFASAPTNLSLLAASPAISEGTEHSLYDTFYSTYGIDIQKDIVGATRPINTWDIGAYEYNEAVAPQSLGTVLLGQ